MLTFLRCFHVLCLFLLAFSCCIINISEAANFEDTRCICKCDKTWDPSGNKAVFINTTQGELCDCEHLVKPSYPSLPCSGCICDVQTRNTTTIKVVVFFILSVISLLLIFMIFLTCVDPIIQRCLDSYLQHTSKDLNSKDETKTKTEEAISPTETAHLPVKKFSLLNLVHKKQKKWEGTVNEQRKNIYGRHSKLK